MRQALQFPVGNLEQVARVASDSVIELGKKQQVGDCLERFIDLMGDAGSKTAGRSELLRAAQRLLSAPVRSVVADIQDDSVMWLRINLEVIPEFAFAAGKILFEVHGHAFILQRLKFASTGVPIRSGYASHRISPIFGPLDNVERFAAAGFR